MSGFRFELGTKVVAHSIRSRPQSNGHVGVIVDRGYINARHIPTGVIERNVEAYLLDPPTQVLEDGRAVWVKPKHLAPYDPPSAWEDCAWKPEEVNA